MKLQQNAVFRIFRAVYGTRSEDGLLHRSPAFIEPCLKGCVRKELSVVSQRYSFSHLVPQICVRNSQEFLFLVFFS